MKKKMEFRANVVKLFDSSECFPIFPAKDILSGYNIPKMLLGLKNHFS